MTRKHLATILVLLGAAGCNQEFCDIVECADGPAGGGGANGGGGQGGSPQGGNGGGGDGGGGGIPAGCDPRVEETISEECGIFVNTGASGAESGTQAEPFKSLAAALAAAPVNGLIYVCSNELTEAVVVAAPVSVFGGLDCATWAPTASRTPWTADENAIPLRLESEASGALVYGVAITSAEASGFDATTLHGNSSIAVVVDGATATLQNVTVQAGGGAPGFEGEDIAGQAAGRQSNAPAFDGNMGGGCGAAGGPQKQFTCNGVNTRGGKGGDGDLEVGAAGLAGSPNPGLGEPDGTPGNGDTGVGGWSCGSNGGNGEIGHDGPTGTPGTAGTSLGTLSATSLYEGAAGGPGSTGIVGQGGGGGGGRRGDGQNGCSAGQAGPSGGSGGAGGCGGVGGGGGGAGGASIAILSLNASLTLVDVVLTAAAGGAGGDGGDGQLGGNGGNGANGGGNACTGGAGGAGGLGGAGGGGRGGPSIGIAYLGAEPDLSDDAITVSLQPAAGGAGGNGGAQSNGGVMGLVAKKQSFR